jgi:hypothetical protein
MRQLRLLLKNINVINIVLTAALLVFVFFVLLPSTRPDTVEYPDPFKKEVSDTEEEIAVNDDRQSTFQADFTVIAERNLFHPDRKIPEPEPVKKEPEERPEFILYGTMLISGAKIAYMEDGNSPETTPGRGKRQKALKEGEEFSGYTLARVYHEKVVMVKEDDTIEVPIVNPSKPKQRGGSKKKTVVKRKQTRKKTTRAERRKSRRTRRSRR